MHISARTWGGRILTLRLYSTWNQQAFLFCVNGETQEAEVFDWNLPGAGVLRRCQDPKCNGRGFCDYELGECRCNPGYVGASCEKTAFRECGPGLDLFFFPFPPPKVGAFGGIEIRTHDVLSFFLSLSLFNNNYFLKESLYLYDLCSIARRNNGDNACFQVFFSSSKITRQVTHSDRVPMTGLLECPPPGRCQEDVGLCFCGPETANPNRILPYSCKPKGMFGGKFEKWEIFGVNPQDPVDLGWCQEPSYAPWLPQ